MSKSLLRQNPYKLLCSSALGYDGAPMNQTRHRHLQCFVGWIPYCQLTAQGHSTIQRHGR